MLKKLFLTFLTLLVPSACFGGVVLLKATDAELPTLGAATLTTVIDDAPVPEHQWDVVEFDGSTDTCAIWHFVYPADYPVASDPIPNIHGVKLDADPPSGTLAQFQFFVGCLDHTEDWNAPALAGGGVFTLTPLSKFQLVQTTNPVFQYIPGLGCSPQDAVILRMCRYGALDPNNESYGVVELLLSY